MQATQIPCFWCQWQCRQHGALDWNDGLHNNQPWVSMDVLLLDGAVHFASSLPGGGGTMTSADGTVPTLLRYTAHGFSRVKVLLLDWRLPPPSCPQGFDNNQHIKAVKSELQNAKDDNFIDCWDNYSPTNSVVRMKMLYTDERGGRNRVF
jgi:hypothetical protein